MTLEETLEPPSEAVLARLAPFAPVPGRPDLTARQAPNLFALWQAWEKESGRKQDIPYWSTVWPAARMAAEFLEREPGTVRGRIVLDFGCGGGIAGIAALKAGAARAIANDIDPAALRMAGINAEANGVRLETEPRNLLAEPPSPAWNVILVADLFYERSVADTMLAWLGRARENGTVVLIADASRPFGPTRGVELLREEKFPTDPDLEGASERTVRLLAYLP